MNLEKHFTAPNTISPFYVNVIRIPRKLKKQVKKFCGVHWVRLTNEQRLWHYMEKQNKAYKAFLIGEICSDSELNNQS